MLLFGWVMTSHYLKLRRRRIKSAKEVMINFAIKTHQPGVTYKKPHLFALSRGYNTGKPLQKECPNCFVILMQSEDEVMKMYFLLEGLWHKQVFRAQLVGSVIPFLRVHEFTKTLVRFWEHIHDNENRVEKLIDTFKTIERLEKHMASYIRLLKMYKQVAYMDVLKIKELDF